MTLLSKSGAGLLGRILDDMTAQQIGALKAGLELDDPALVQGYTETINADGLVTGACLVCYGPWKASGLTLREEVEDVMLAAADSAVANWSTADFANLINWWDEGERQKVRAEALRQVQLSLQRVPRDG